MQKLGLRPVQGIVRVTLKKSKNMIFAISQPDVFKSPSSDTYIIFGEAKVEDPSAHASSKAAEQFRAPEPPRQTPAVPAPAPVNKPTVISDDGNVDESGVDLKDIELVIGQSGCTRSQAVKALKSNDNDIVNAIMELTM